MVNLVGGLYPGLYDWCVEVEVPPQPPIRPGVCLTSEISVRDCVTADLTQSETEITSDCVSVKSLEPDVATTALAMTCEIVATVSVQADVECRDRIVGEVCVLVNEPADDILGPSMCAEIDIRQLVTASAIDCTTVQVVADLDVRTMVVAEVQCCCLETSHE